MNHHQERNVSKSRKPRTEVRHGTLSRAWLIPVALVLACSAAVAISSLSPALQLNYELTQVSDQGFYRITVAPTVDPVPIKQVHSWLVEVTDPNGAAVAAEVAVKGEMPDHHHGFSTAPKVTGKDPEGRHIVKDIRFDMPGWWVLEVEVKGAAGEDTASFNLEL